MEVNDPGENKSSDGDNSDSDNITVEALSALREFHDEQEFIQNVRLVYGEHDAAERLMENDLSKFFPEDWQISQFWYDTETTRVLVNEVKRLSGSQGKVACISCPSVFRCCGLTPNVHLFEYDKRFEAFGSAFFFYDYKYPENIPDSCCKKYSVIILDPPFLTPECLGNMAITVNKLAEPNARIILCTGVLLEKEAEEYLHLKKSSFIPKHRSNGIHLRHEFGCFTNYTLDIADCTNHLN